MKSNEEFRMRWNSDIERKLIDSLAGKFQRGNDNQNGGGGSSNCCVKACALDEHRRNKK